MRDPKEIQEPLKTMRNSQTKLLRQATPEEIVKAALSGGKLDKNKNTYSRAGAGGSRKKRTKKQPLGKVAPNNSPNNFFQRLRQKTRKTTFTKGCAKKTRKTTFGKGYAKSM